MPACSAFGMLPGADRPVPVLAATIPAWRHAAIVLDVGASVAYRPLQFLQVAVMGRVSARVALLSIGEEESTGCKLPRSIAAAAAGLHR